MRLSYSQSEIRVFSFSEEQIFQIPKLLQKVIYEEIYL